MTRRGAFVIGRACGLLGLLGAVALASCADTDMTPGQGDPASSATSLPSPSLAYTPSYPAAASPLPTAPAGSDAAAIIAFLTALCDQEVPDGATGGQLNTNGTEPRILGDYATIDYQCRFTQGGRPVEKPLQHIYLKKDSDGAWDWQMSSPGLLSCRNVEGSGWPAEIIGGTCFDNDLGAERPITGG